MNRRQFFGLLAMTAGALLVHGYHPYAEDAEIYVPGIKKLLNPALYPFNDGIFISHARMTLFPNLVAWSVRISHLPLEWALLGWHFACISLLLAACWRLARICFKSTRAAWGSAALVASLLTIPVAGTALYIVDQYLNPRGFSTPAAMWIVLAAVERKYLRAAILLAISALIHPLMAVFALGFGLLLLIWTRWTQSAPRQSHLHVPRAAFIFIILPLSLFPPVTNAYRQALDRHSYLFLLRWEWYECLGIVGPLLILFGIGRMARRKGLVVLEALCFTSVIFGFLVLVAGLILTVPPQLIRFVELQPMRGLHLIYVLLFTICGGLLAEHVWKTKLWRWLAFFVPLCAGMFYAQRELFPASPHVEWPGRKSGSQWMQAFLWIKDNTPRQAYFALDPDHMRVAGEDQQGFRAISERSRLADSVKDSAVTMFPVLAPAWLEQVNSLAGWKTFEAPDFERLRRVYGVDWIVLQRPGVAGLECPYRNARVLVCRINQLDTSAKRPKQSRISSSRGLTLQPG